MTGLLKILILINVVSVAIMTDQKVECGDLGLSFMIPTTFKSIDSVELKRLEKKGDKVVKEEFNRGTLKSWQSPCLNFKDSLSRMFVITSIPVKEAMRINGSADKFIRQTFADGNRFNIQRIKTKLGIDIDEKNAVKQSSISIGGMPVAKNEFIATWSGINIFASYQYFIKKGDKLFFLTFLGSPKATDNDELVKAIEAGKPISR